MLLDMAIDNYRAQSMDALKLFFPELRMDELAKAMAEAKEEGLIRHIGITTHKVTLAHEALDSGLYETLQYPFSYLSGREELELVEKCRKKTT